MRLAFSACAMVIAVPAMAGPPFQTDDPKPVDLHHYEFYVASQQTLTADGRSGTLPHFEFNYGALPNLQLHIMAPYAFSSPSGGPTQHGYGDTELGLKYRCVQETDNVPMVGIFPMYEAPTDNAARGLGNGAAQFFLPIWLQKSWGKWSSYGGGGYPWYRAVPPTGTADLSMFPRSLLMSSPTTAGWHNFGMEWKEHVTWLVPIAMTMVAYVYGKYRTNLARQSALRKSVLVCAVNAFVATAAAGAFGVFLKNMLRCGAARTSI